VAGIDVEAISFRQSIRIIEYDDPEETGMEEGNHTTIQRRSRDLPGPDRSETNMSLPVSPGWFAREDPK